MKRIVSATVNGREARLRMQRSPRPARAHLTGQYTLRRIDRSNQNNIERPLPAWGSTVNANQRGRERKATCDGTVSDVLCGPPMHTSLLP